MVEIPDRYLSFLLDMLLASRDALPVIRGDTRMSVPIVPDNLVAVTTIDLIKRKYDLAGADIGESTVGMGELSSPCRQSLGSYS